MEKAVITSIEQLKTLENSEQGNITELEINDLTERLNNDDVKISQAAGFIKEIIRQQKSLQVISLQNNVFPPPELQFIIKAIIDKQKDGNASRLKAINLTNAISSDNLERSNRELRHLQQVYGDNIALDDAVYTYFINGYDLACQDYLKFIAKEIILPKKAKNVEVDNDQLLEKTDALLKDHDLRSGTDNKLNDGVIKYRLLRDLQQTLQQQTGPLAQLKAFQSQYEKIRKKFPEPRTKPETEKAQKFHSQVGDTKAESFNFPKKHPNSIFKLAVKKTRKKAKSKAKRKKPAKAGLQA